MEAKKGTKSKDKKPKASRLGSDPLNVFKEIKEEESNRHSKREIVETEKLIDDKSIRKVPIKYVSPDPDQPRKQIDPKSEGIKELAKSIAKYGFINFVTVREKAENEYTIVAGERRYTAAKVAGLSEIPVIVIPKDKAPVDYALIQMEENLQREDLTPFDELEGYNRLVSEFGLQQKEIVELVNKSKSYISKMMGINKLSEKIRDDIHQWEIEVSRDILWDVSSFAEEDQKFIWKRIRSKPVRSVLDKAKKQLVESKEKEKGKASGKKDDGYEPEVIWEALKKAVSKDKGVLLQFLTPKKIEKLLQDYGVNPPK